MSTQKSIKDTQFDSKMSKSVSRSRNWATVVYPDSAPDQWLSVLQDQMLNGFVSPIHDSDCEEDGEIKKAHYHVLIAFSSMKSKDQVSDIFQKFGGVGCEKISDFRSYSRYLCHLDQPNKFQYDKNDVIALGSLDYLKTIESGSDKYKLNREMIQFCKENPDTIRFSFAKLVEYSMENNEEWFRALCDTSSYFIKSFLKSAEWEYEKALRKLEAEDRYNSVCRDIREE